MLVGSSTFKGEEGQSTVRPPFFTGTNYAYWKIKMMTWLEGQELWEIVEEDFVRPTAKGLARKTEEKAAITANAKAMTSLFCAIDVNEFNRVSVCKTAHEIWHNLEVTHEGTNKVKQSKICLFIRKYELFKMQENETVEDMIARFTEITNALEGLGKTYTSFEKVLKVLSALTPEWSGKMTAIEESNDLSKYPLEELFGNLKAYQLRLSTIKDDASSKKKEIAFNANTLPEDSELDNDTMAMLVRNYKKMFRKGNTSSSFDLSNTVCYKCNKTGHMKKDCPLNQNKEGSSKYYKEDHYKYRKNDKYKKDKYKSRKGDRHKYYKKKAYAATWDDSSSSDDATSSSDNEQAQVCFMALGDNTAVLDPESDIEEVNQEELLIAHHTLFANFTKLYDAHKLLKKEHENMKKTSNHTEDLESLRKEKDTLLTLNSTLSSEKVNLNNEIQTLKVRLTDLDTTLSSLTKKHETMNETIARFNKGKGKLDDLLKDQIPHNNRKGLGFASTSGTKPVSSKERFRKTGKSFKKIQPSSYFIHVPKLLNKNDRSLYIHSYFTNIIHNEDYLGKPNNTWVWFPKN